MPLELTPAQPHQLDAVCALYRGAGALPERELGYPRWSTPAELRAEFAVYGSAPGADLWLAWDGGCLRAVTGILAGPTDTSGYLIGPVVCAERRQSELLAELLARAEARASQRLRALLASPSARNAELWAALGARGWQLREESFEMRWTPAAARPVALRALPAEPRRLGPGSSAAQLDAAAALLAVAFGWRDAERRLRECAAEQCVEALELDGDCAAVLVWGRVGAQDFGRIEYLAVAEPLRGRGLGGALLERVLATARTQGLASLYLSVREDSAAVRLYARCGFEVGRCARLYARGLAAGVAT